MSGKIVDLRAMTNEDLMNKFRTEREYVWFDYGKELLRRLTAAPQTLKESSTAELGNCISPHWLGKPIEGGNALQQTPHPQDSGCKKWEAVSSKSNPRAESAAAPQVQRETEEFPPLSNLERTELNELRMEAGLPYDEKLVTYTKAAAPAGAQASIKPHCPKCGAGDDEYVSTITSRGVEFSCACGFYGAFPKLSELAQFFSSPSAQPWPNYLPKNGMGAITAIINLWLSEFKTSPSAEQIREAAQVIDALLGAGMAGERVSSPSAQPTGEAGSEGLDNSRCAVCAWPLADTIEKGCVRGNCSMRPFPASTYDPERANREYGQRLFYVPERVSSPRSAQIEKATREIRETYIAANPKERREEIVTHIVEIISAALPSQPAEAQLCQCGHDYFDHYYKISEGKRTFCGICSCGIFRAALPGQISPAPEYDPRTDPATNWVLDYALELERIQESRNHVLTDERGNKSPVLTRGTIIDTIWKYLRPSQSSEGPRCPLHPETGLHLAPKHRDHWPEEWFCNAPDCDIRFVEMRPSQPHCTCATAGDDSSCKFHYPQAEPSEGLERVAREIAEMVANDVYNLTAQRIDYFLPLIKAILARHFSGGKGAELKCAKCLSYEGALSEARAGFEFIVNNRPIEDDLAGTIRAYKVEAVEKLAALTGSAVEEPREEHHCPACGRWHSIMKYQAAPARKEDRAE